MTIADMSHSINRTVKDWQRPITVGQLVVIQSDIKMVGDELHEYGETTVGIIREISDGIVFLETPVSKELFVVKTCRVRPIAGTDIETFLAYAIKNTTEM